MSKLGLVLAVSMLVLTACSFSGKTIKTDGVDYGYRVVSCVNMPDIASKVKEGLGGKKVCILAGAQVVIVPVDYDFDAPH